TSPDDPTQTGTISTCDRWYDVVDGDTCASVEATFGITADEFLAWNPAVSSDCETGFWVGDSYCVGISTATPNPTGQASDCDEWYDVVEGDSCDEVAEAFGITTAQFLAWNPSISSDCTTGFNAGYAYCVGVNPNATTTSSSSIISNATTAVRTSATATYSILGNETSAVLNPWPTATGFPPTPTQTGIISDCLRYYQAQAGSSCQGIVNIYSHYMTMGDFLEWNPAVGTNCTALYVGWYYCIDAPMAVNTSTATTQIIDGWTPAALPTMNSTFAPAPTVTGLISSCQAYYEANEGDTCSNVTSSLGYLDVTQFEEWNTGINCSSALTEGTYYCVGNFTTNPLPSTTSVQPTAVQSGITASCTGWYLADDDDTCTDIVMMFGTFSEADFLAWNPAVGNDCSGLTGGDYYCVAVPGTPTTATTSYTTATYSTNGVGPQPEQTGIPDDCSSYWLVGVDDTCASIEDANSITQDEFLDWNPALGSNCSSLLENYYVCVLTPNATTTGGNLTIFPDNSTSTSIVTSSSLVTSFASSTTSSTTGASLATPTPYQSGMVSGCERFYLVEEGNDCYDIALEANIAESDFYAWNPAVGTDCSGLEAGEYVCLGTTGPAVTMTTGTPIP
ncbi:hypothetical protein BO71DRAFT_282154, partial [Aspergillus ellipticus CBS 707.79]